MQNKKSNSEAVIRHIRKRKRDLIKVFHSKCCICGFDSFPQALQFHNVNPQEKSFGITDSNSVTKALEKQLEEMRKCVLVCANCHRGIHQGYIQLPKNYQQLFDEKIAEQLLKGKQKKKYFCKKCGKEISKNSKGYCVDCAHFFQRKVEQRPTREELKDKIYNFPFTSIAKEYNVSDNTIRKWCESYNLPSKKKDIKTFTLQSWKKI